MSGSIDTQAENLDNVEVSLSIHMNLGDWKRLYNHLNRDCPSWQPGQAIAQTIERAVEYFRNAAPPSPRREE